MSAATLFLKRDEERRLKAGHSWVFSNEVDTQKSPITQFEPGQAVVIADQRGHPLGSGYVNPNSLICARLVSRDPNQSLNQSLITHRLNIALSLREHLYARPFYRLIFGDSDGLPGLVVDRFGEVLVAQITTAGMERVKEEILGALDKVVKPRSILWRNDTNVRDLEGLTQYVELAQGEPVEHIVVEEHDCAFTANALTGQKTGWFFDQRANRNRMRDYVNGRRVLDVFSYVGAWGVQAAKAGAREVVCVDASREAIDLVSRNAAANGVTAQVTGVRGDAFEYLKELRSDKQPFDVVIVDPPAFIQRKKDVKSGIEAYRRLNQQAMQVLAKDGILIAASCSSYLQQDVLQQLLQKSSRHLDRQLQLLEHGYQAPDHPIHPAIGETAYLKAFFCRVLPTF